MSTAEMINHELAACWEMCCDAVGIDTDATAAEWREAYEAERAQVRREAAVKTLREAARAFEAATINIQIFGNSPEAELVRVDNAARARFVESLRGRADRMEAGE